MTECKCCGEECVVNPSELCEGCAKEAAAEFRLILERINISDRAYRSFGHPRGANSFEMLLNIITNDARDALSKFYGKAETK